MHYLQYFASINLLVYYLYKVAYFEFYYLYLIHKELQ